MVDFVPIRPAWRPALTAPERIPVSEWADKYRVLDREYSSEPGPWRTARIPYTAGIMDAFTDSRVRTIVIAKSTRVGITETMNNMLGFAIDQEPGGVLYIYPDSDAAKDEATGRLTSMIEGSPRLAGHIPYDGWSTNKQLKLDSLTIKMGWATSVRKLQRITVRYVAFDELDNCEKQASRFGDVYELGCDRVTTWGDRAKILVCSSLSRPDAATHRLWLKSDQRRYHVPCPLCGTYQVLSFDRIKVPEGMRDPNEIRIDDLAWYECAGCNGKLIDKEHKEWMVARGVWVQEGRKIVERLPLKKPKIVERAVFNAIDRWTPAIEGPIPKNDIAGFHIWTAYSPWRSWSSIIAKWFEVKDNRDEKIVFYNSWLGEPWEEVTTTTNTARVRERSIGGMGRGFIPDASPLILVAGIDVQQSRIYYESRAWGPGMENWLVDYGYYACLTDRDTIISVINRWYQDHFLAVKYHRPDGTSIPIRAALIDSGDGNVTRQIYEFCKRHPGMFACKGEDKDVFGQYVRRANPEPKRKPGELPHPLHARQLWLVNVNRCKDTLYALANAEGAGPNTMHLPANIDEEWLKQFTSEHKVYDSDKRREIWKPKTAGRANHYLDAAVYSLAAAELCGALSLKAPEKDKVRDKRKTPRGVGTANPRKFLERYSHSV